MFVGKLVVFLCVCEALWITSAYLDIEEYVMTYFILGILSLFGTFTYVLAYRELAADEDGVPFDGIAFSSRFMTLFLCAIALTISFCHQRRFGSGGHTFYGQDFFPDLFGTWGVPEFIFVGISSLLVISYFIRFSVSWCSGGSIAQKFLTLLMTPLLFFFSVFGLFRR